MDESESNTRFSCRDCQAEFQTQDSFSEHRIRCGGGRPQSFTTKLEKDADSRMSNTCWGSNTRFRCRDCQAEFPSQDSFSEHRARCSGGRPQSSTTKLEKDADSRMSNTCSGSNTRFRCKDCQAEFPTKDSFLEHRTHCRGGRPQSCSTKVEKDADSRMSNTYSGSNTRFRCRDCHIEFPTQNSFSEHRTRCSGGSSQSSSTKPEKDADSRMNPLDTLLTQSLLADVDATTRRKRKAYNMAVSAARETRDHNDSLNRITSLEDSLYVTLMEAHGRLRVAIESKASKSERFMCKARMNHARQQMALLSRQEKWYCTALHRAIVEQAVATEKFLEAMAVERSTFKFAMSLIPLEADNTAQPAPTPQTENF